MSNPIEIIESNSKEHQQAIDAMLPYMDDGVPQLGIFWLDTGSMSLFGVQKGPAEIYISEGKLTYPKLHKTYWQKQHHRARAKNETSSIFYNEGDYTKIPRGRIFFINGEFVVRIGDWYKLVDIDKLTELIEDEFNIEGFKYQIDPHWNLGAGWSEERF